MEDVKPTDSPAGIADDQIEELLRLDAAATPGSWTKLFQTNIQAPHPLGGKMCPLTNSSITLERRGWNYDLIVAMRNAIKPLIARLKRAEAERDAWRTQCVDAADSLNSAANAMLEKNGKIKQLESERDRLKEALELADELMDAMDTWLALKDEPPLNWLAAGTQVCLAADRLRNHRAAAALADKENI